MSHAFITIYLPSCIISHTKSLISHSEAPSLPLFGYFYDNEPYMTCIVRQCGKNGMFENASLEGSNVDFRNVGCVVFGGAKEGISAPLNAPFIVLTYDEQAKGISRHCGADSAHGPECFRINFQNLHHSEHESSPWSARTSSRKRQRSSDPPQVTIVYYDEKIASDPVNFYRVRKPSKNSRSVKTHTTKSSTSPAESPVPVPAASNAAPHSIFPTPTPSPTIPLHLINRTNKGSALASTSSLTKIFSTFFNPIGICIAFVIHILLSGIEKWKYLVEKCILNGFFHSVFIRHLSFRLHEILLLIGHGADDESTETQSRRRFHNSESTESTSPPITPSKRKFDSHISDKSHILVQILVDILFGIIAAIIINHHEQNIRHYTHIVWFSFTRRFASHIQWLMGHPAGLKLNHELSRVVGMFLKGGIFWWQDVLKMVYMPIEHILVGFLKVIGCTGISFMIAFVMDIGSIVTLHLTIFYLLITRVYSIQTGMMLSFWRLFRGHKYNVLRKRVDNGQFRIDQMVVGTLLLGVATFLYPTVACYYASFAIVELFIIFLKRFLNVCLCIMKEFPFYEFLFHSTKRNDVYFDFFGISMDGRVSYFFLESHYSLRWLTTVLKTSILVDMKFPWLMVRRLLRGEILMKSDGDAK